MRLFAGVELDSPVKASAVDVAVRLRDRLHRVAPDLQARWVPADNLHVTLWFIGEVDAARGVAIQQALAGAPFPTAAFDLALAGCGAFPPSGPPRVFWIGAERGTGEMAALYGEVGARLAPLGFVPERRAYTAHLTIARVKDPGRGTSRAVRAALDATPAACGVSRVSAVTLFQSRLSPKGAAYEPLLRVPLS